MNRSEKNAFIQQAVKEQVLSNPSYAQTRKKILILALIPAAFLVIDRVIAIAQGALASGNATGLLWGFVLMALVVVSAVNAEIVAASVWLFLSAGISAISLIGQVALYGLGNINIPLFLFYVVYIVVFVVIAVVLLVDPQIKAYRAHAKDVKSCAKAEASRM